MYHAAEQSVPAKLVGFSKPDTFCKELIARCVIGVLLVVVKAILDFSGTDTLSEKHSKSSSGFGGGIDSQEWEAINERKRLAFCNCNACRDHLQLE